MSHVGAYVMSPLVDVRGKTVPDALVHVLGGIIVSRRSLNRLNKKNVLDYIDLIN